jgi:NhaA family Na+:H+ antiporter
MADENKTQAPFPDEPIHRLARPLARFLHVEAASGVVLLAAAVVAFAIANSPLADWFLGLWKTRLAFGIGDFTMDHSLKHWVSDGLMAVFFFVVGLEVKREIVLGQLRDLRQAALPIAAALGGMVVPAAIYLAFLWGDAAARGLGIPMATDIAFVVGCLAVLGKRVPQSLRVLLLSLAIADDIGAILVIAIGYTDTLNVNALVLAGVGLAFVVLMRRVGVRSIPAYTIVGALVWVGFHESGVHATIAGVLLGLLTPTDRWVSESILSGVVARAREVWQGESADRAHSLRQIQTAARESLSPLERLENGIHPWSAFLIMPVFALANAGVAFEAALLTDPVSVAVAAGLVLGKPLGIVLFSYVGVLLGVASLPDGVNWRVLTAGACLAGIGFTMSLFIAGLALEGPALEAAKMGVLGGSVISGVIGMTLLIRFLRPPSDS